VDQGRNGRTEETRYGEGIRNPRARQRAFCIAVSPDEPDLSELRELLRTAGVAVAGEMTQRRPSPDPDRYFGKGKLGELKQAIKAADANLVACDDELSPRQERNLEKELGVAVIDRTAVILDIFADHAKSAEGNLQVELAQLEYNLARMRGLWTHLERLGAGIGTRGPGESQIETDRRLNAVTGADAEVRDRLFHTLDPLTRSFEISGRQYLLTDTVGFIRKLPHQLVEAFAATLEEALYADLILHVADASAPEDELADMLGAVDDVLAEIGAAERPRLLVLNKVDLLDEDHRRELSFRHPRAVQVSAVTGEGLEELRSAIEARFLATLEPMELLVPYDEGGRLSELHEVAGEMHREDTASGVRVRARVPAGVAPRFERFSVNGRNGSSE
jgi:GTPase